MEHIRKQKTSIINKEIAFQLTNVMLYRYSVLTTFRDEYYNVRVTLKELAKMAGEKESSFQTFNKALIGIIETKKYRGEENLFGRPLRTLYKILDMDNTTLTLSSTFTKLPIDSNIKGYYIKLLLISENRALPFTQARICKTCGITKNKYHEYNLKLKEQGLLQYTSKGLMLTPGNLVMDNSDVKPKKFAPQRTMPPLFEGCSLEGKPILVYPLKKK